MGLVFLDGNRRNGSLENLFEVTTEELKLFHRRKSERLSPELTKALFLQIRLELKLKELADTFTATHTVPKAQKKA